jgi:hypothetical protein
MTEEEVKKVMREEMLNNPLPIADAPDPDPKTQNALLEEPKAEDWMHVEGPYEWCRGFFADGQYPEVGDVLAIECCQMEASGDGSAHGAVRLGFRLRKLRPNVDFVVGDGARTGRLSSTTPPASNMQVDESTNNNAVAATVLAAVSAVIK